MATERPILFSGAMVRAILDGTKTQTRRVVTPQPEWAEFVDPEGYDDSTGEPGRPDVWAFGAPLRAQFLRCPYGAPGDRLWVREAHQVQSRGWAPPTVASATLRFRADEQLACVHLASEVEAEQALRGVLHCGGTSDRWRPGIHMPRWASRLTLEVVDVRVERVQDITADDARAEGVHIEGCDHVRRSCEEIGCRGPLSDFADLWDSINGPRGFGWDANPWVWCVDFRRVEA